MGVGFSVNERAPIAEGFGRLAADLPAATDCFYHHLFRLAPDTRALFVTDLGRQGAKLAQTLELVVGRLDRWGFLREQVVDLAIRHLAYGVRREHCPAVEAALLAMLREQFNLEPMAEAAWRRLVNALSETMIEAAYPPTPSENEPSGGRPTG